MICKVTQASVFSKKRRNTQENRIICKVVVDEKGLFLPALKAGKAFVMPQVLQVTICGGDRSLTIR